MINKVLSRTGIVFLYLLSLMPFWLLYLIADVLYLVLYYITKYRRGVVQENLRNAFPEKMAGERAAIEKKYYKYLADLIMEVIKCITMSPAQVQARMYTTNPETAANYFKNGKSIIAATAHYGNWEMACLGFGFVTHEKRIIVYKPLSNKILERFFNDVRSRFGSMMIPMKQILRKLVELRKEPTFTILASDQTPGKEDAQEFTTFLNQDTAVFLGAEKMSKITDAAVVFYRIDLVKRGFYTGTIVPLANNPKETKPGEITALHVKYLETMINEKPEYWLWSHRRWKYKPEVAHK